MFNPVKQAGEMKKLRDEAKKIEKELEQIEVTKENNNIKVKVNGNMKVLKIDFEGEVDGDELANTVNDAMKEAQKKAAVKMQQLGGGLKGLLGG